jgi:hypothetical protein
MKNLFFAVLPTLSLTLLFVLGIYLAKYIIHRLKVGQ